jgi:hypothetical protein
MRSWSWVCAAQALKRTSTFKVDNLRYIAEILDEVRSSRTRLLAAELEF